MSIIQGANSNPFAGDIVPITTEVTVDSGDTSKTTDRRVEAGWISQIIFDAPSLNGSGATAELKILDADGYELYASGELAEDITHVINVARRLPNGFKIKIETSITVAADKEFTVKLL